MAGEEEIKKPWPSGYTEAQTINDFDYLMTGKNGAPLTKFDKDKYKQYLSTTGQRMKSVAAGALPAGPVDKEMYMVLESPGRWIFGENNFDNVEGQIMTLWWNKTTYSVDNISVLPVAPADGLVVLGDTKAPSGDLVFKAIEPIDKTLYDEVATCSPNLYNPARTYPNQLVSTGVNVGIIGYSTGWVCIVINGMKPLTWYTITNWNSVRNELATFTGDLPDVLPQNYSTGLIASGSSSSVVGATKVSGKLTFKTLANMSALVVNVKNATEASTVYSTFQIVEGEVEKPYQPWNPGSIEKVLKSQFKPSGKIKEISFASNIVNIRTQYSNEKDLVRSIGLFASNNGASNLLSTKLIFSTDPITVAGEVIHSQNDSAPPPFQVLSRKESATTYFNVAGNHGLPTVSDITATAHNKTSEDLGSIWSDANGDQFYLIAILSSNSLRIVPKPVNIDGFDKVKNSAVSPLSHVSGAVHTSSFTFTGAPYEYTPAINNILVKLYIDDVEIASEGTYVGDVVKVVDTHNVVDPTKPNLVAPYLPQNGGTMVKNTFIHTFYHNGSYTAEQIADWQANHKIANQGIVQPQVLTIGSYTGLKAYSANIGTVGSSDFKNGVDLTGAVATSVVANSGKIDSNKSIQLITEILSNSTGPSIGFGCAYNPLVALGKQSELAQNSSIFELRNTKKFYPRAFTRESQSKILRANGIYTYWDASINPKLSADFFVPFGNTDVYFLNIRVAMVKEKVFLPKELQLREFDLINSSTGIILNTEESTTSEGLIISGGIGDWCVLKIK
ncbi:hypothetical protein [Sphingobacterium anhuiense]|uniref:hypothetical protein n=1 Tax=Sphingobacterium anhuiense TaxID=493780 RepID=UPI003C2F3654